ncbi:MAG: hypothetical protein LH654_02350, partial [Thermoleophilia bacterium]|nr:hypothetical protein [Thermoleophilia bacterium]
PGGGGPPRGAPPHLTGARALGALVLKAFHREPGIRASAALDDALDRALDRLRRTCGLETVRR